MANEEHAKILATGVQVWNQWRRNNPEISPDLSHIRTYDASARRLFGADPTGALGLVMYDSSSESNPTIVAPSNLVGANFSHANLSGANFYGARVSRANFYCADLIGANFSEAILDSANLCGAILSGARFDRANLCGAQFYRTNLREVLFSEANLSEADLREADLSRANLDHANLVTADLEGANLSETQLISANLTGANFTGADLTNALLIIVRALGTRFDRAIMTGACIQDWSINSSTSLQDVVCDYVFIKSEFHSNESFQWVGRDRRPHDLERNFALGEFTKRYQKVLETIELFFEDGIDWKALLASLQDFQAGYGGELSIQEMRQGAGGGFGLALGIPPELDKGAFERWLYEQYESKLQLVEAEHRAEIKALNEENKEVVATIRQQHDNQMLEMVKVFVNSTNNSNSISLAVNTAQVQQSALTSQQSNDAKTEEKPPEDKSKWNRIKAIALGIGAVVVGVLTWAVTATEQLQTFSEKWGIDIPFLVESEGAEQAPVAPSPSSSASPSP